MIDNIENTAKAFANAGVKKEDIVTFVAVTTPEIINAFYALNSIGAIANMIDSRTSKKQISEYVKEVNSNIIVIIDLAYARIEDVMTNKNIEKVIVVSISDSMSLAKGWDTE